MAMNWLKGLVAPAADFPGSAQGVPPGMSPQGGPPIGGSPYGVQGQAQPLGAGPPPGAPMPEAAPAYVPPQWSTGTRTQGESTGIAKATPAGLSGGTDARVAQLQHDLESMALFARTLLTMLEEKNVVTRAEFEATKNRLDMLDGKLDDR